MAQRRRTFAIGDVHGCDTALETLLDAVKPVAGDTVIFLGDLCDRGPDTKRAIELILGQRSICSVKLILGNHDEMMLGVFGRHAACDLAFWWGVGGAETLESYGGDPHAVPEEHLDFLASGLPYLESDSTIFIHADLEPGVALDRQDADWLRWRKIDGTEPPHPSGKRVVCGHTSQKEGRPLVWDGWVCIDTRVYDQGGKLTALDIHTDEVYQADQDGNVAGPVPLSSVSNEA